MSMQILRFSEMMNRLMEVDNLEESLSQIVREMERELEFQSLGIFLHNDNHTSFRLKISRNLSHAYTKRTEYQFDHAVVRHLQHGKTLHSKNPDDIPYEKTYHHLVAMPLRYHGNLLGFIFADHASREFTEEDLAVLGSFAALCSLVICIYEQQRRIESLTQFDAITGLFTFRHFHQRAEVAFQQARRYDHPLSLVVFKLGKYKEIYRKLGMQEAGQIMARVAEVLRENLRVMEVIGLIYPDTIAILLPDSPAGDIDYVVGRLQGTILEISEHMADGLLAWGAASVTEGYKDVDDMIRHAEEAAYEACRLPGPLRLKHPDVS